MGIGVGILAVASLFSAANSIDSARSAKNQAKDAANRAKADSDALAAAINKPVPVVPDPDDAGAQDARRRSIAQQLARRGRASTVLTNDDSAGQALGA